MVEHKQDPTENQRMFDTFIRACVGVIVAVAVILIFLAIVGT
ncbi:MAG: hypothetical protein ACFBSD_07695 [Paracoccaceae bacterium]